MPASVLKIFFLAAVCSYFMDCTSDNPFGYALGLAVSALLLVSCVTLPLERKIFPILLILIVAPDIVQATGDIEMVGVLGSASLWCLSIAGIGASWMILSLLLITGHLMRVKVVPEKLDTAFIVYFFSVPIVASLAYGFLAPENIRRAITDIKLPVMFLAGMYYFTKYFRCFPKHFVGVVRFALICTCSRVFVDAFYLMFQIARTTIGGVNRVSVDSGKVIIALAIGWLVSRILSRKQMLLCLICLAICLTLLISYQTRFVILTTILGLGIYVMLERTSKFAIGIAVACLLFGLFSLTQFKVLENALDIAGKRFGVSTFMNQGFDLETLDPTRFAAISNALHKQWDSFALLTGMGFGSWYDETSVAMPLNLGGSAYSSDSLASGQYYRIHDMVFHMLFKYGIIGLFLYTWFYIGVTLKLLNRRAVWSRSAFYNETVMVLLFFLPTAAFCLYWTAKVLLMNALYIVVLRETLRHLESQQLRVCFHHVR